MPLAHDARDESSGNFFTRFLARLAEVKLSRRLKRLIYISSIFGVIKQIKDPDMTLITKLNEIFKVARYPDAFIFPMYIKSMIWKSAATRSVIINNKEVPVAGLKCRGLNNEEREEIGVYFAANAPEWLRYGSNTVMVSDVSLLLKQIDLLGAD